MQNPVRTGTMIALAAASLFAAACSKKGDDSSTKTAPAVEKTEKVFCQGANECKGKSACKTAENTCAGQNGCKGKGFVEVASADECKTKGGTVMAGAPKM